MILLMLWLVIAQKTLPRNHSRPKSYSEEDWEFLLHQCMRLLEHNTIDGITIIHADGCVCDNGFPPKKVNHVSTLMLA